MKDLRLISSSMCIRVLYERYWSISSSCSSCCLADAKAIRNVRGSSAASRKPKPNTGLQIHSASACSRLATRCINVKSSVIPADSCSRLPKPRIAYAVAARKCLELLGGARDG